MAPGHEPTAARARNEPRQRLDAGTRHLAGYAAWSDVPEATPGWRVAYQWRSVKAVPVSGVDGLRIKPEHPGELFDDHVEDQVA